MKRNAFTLLELLIVIAIIALLITIVSPCLRRARASASDSICKRNLSDLAAAWLAHSQLNEQNLCGGSTYRSPYLGSYGGGVWDWVVMFDDPGTWKKPSDDPAAIGALYPYINNSEVYRCPSHVFPAYPVSYSMPGTLNGQQVNVFGEAGIWYPYRRRAQIRNPSETVAFLEEFDPRGYNCGSFVLESHETWSDYLAGNHDKGDNFAFTDGHVEYWKYQNDKTLQLLVDFSSEHGYHGDTKLNAPGSVDLDRLWNAYVDYNISLPVIGGLGPWP